jgi:DNA-binding MarR family transcriptional regulator
LYSGTVADRAPGPEAVLAGSIGFLLSKLGFLTSSRFTAALAPFGINPGHFGLLRIIEVSGPNSQQALGEALGIPPSRMVALADDLEGKGLLERRRHVKDRRINELHLTAEGRALLGKASVAGVTWQEELLANLDVAERKQLLELLQRVASAHELPLGAHPAMSEVLPDTDRD